MYLDELLKQGANVTLAIEAEDLREFAQAIAEQTRNEIERDLAENRSEVYYTANQTTRILSVDKTTLWRWNKRNYLKPIKVGGLLRYRKSDIDKILNYGKEEAR